MPAPSQLAIATGSVSRLLKEEASYHAELADQDAQIAKLEANVAASGASEDGNAEFMLKQLKTAREETKTVLGPVKTRVTDAAAKLEDIIAAGGDDAEVSQGRKVLAQAKTKLA